MGAKKALHQEFGTEHEPSPSPDKDDQMPVTAESILALFDTLGLRTTRPRQLIAERLATLASIKADFTVDDLWHELRDIDSKLGRATVYRAVEVLMSQGLFHCLPSADGRHRYRLCGGSHHHHVTCTQCQRVVEVSVCLPPELFATIAITTDFAIEGHSLELFGRCADCRKVNDNPSCKLG